jgi:glucosyl-3-phosphoglycerate synthase
MSDLHQTGVISTLHRFHTSSLEHLEKELEQLSTVRPITLALPARYRELEGEGLKRIVEELKEVKYLHQIVVSLSDANAKEFQHAKEFFSVLPQKVRIIWNQGEQIEKLFQLLEKHNLNIGPDGKGRSVWIALGYMLAEGESYMVAIHDCDIVNYNRGILARLCYPIANPNINYEFCKGYYSRVNNRIYGRVTRLFVTPLIRAMEKTIGYEPLLVYLDSFRYPLAGEFSMTSELARINRIHGDWGVDLGVLTEVFRNCSKKRVCQMSLIDSYEHEHQPLSEDNPEAGLFKMSIDITRVFFRTLASEGVVFSNKLIKTLQATYLITAQDTVKKYNDDAMINNLPFDRYEEGLAVKTFAEGLRLGGNSFLEDPLGHPEIPNWNRVTSAIPEFLEMLKKTVEEDNR